jgi:hypothetical protein
MSTNSLNTAFQSLAACLLLSSSALAADWQQVATYTVQKLPLNLKEWSLAGCSKPETRTPKCDETVPIEVRVYIDAQSRTRTRATLTRAWFLHDYQMNFSQVIYMEAECAERKYRELEKYDHLDRMGRGDSAANTYEMQTNWRYPPPSSVSLSLVDKLCNLYR